VKEGLRDKQRRLVEREIAAAAMRLFDSEGFDAVTVEQIADAAGISSRTFFRYFANKEELLVRYQRQIHARLVTALAARPADEGPVTALREAYIATSHVAPEDRDQVLRSNRFLASSRALRVRLNGESTVDRGPVIALLAERMGLDASDPRLETVAVAVGAVAGASFNRWLSSGGQGDPAEHISRALRLLEDGLAGLDLPAKRRRSA